MNKYLPSYCFAIRATAARGPGSFRFPVAKQSLQQFNWGWHCYLIDNEI